MKKKLNLPGMMEKSSTSQPKDPGIPSGKSSRGGHMPSLVLRPAPLAYGDADTLIIYIM